MEREIKLLEEDPTVWGKCLPCSRTGRGVHTGTYYAKAFTKKKWERDPKCENCGGALTKLYEVE